MKVEQPTPQGEHLNKPKTFAIGFGLFVIFVVTFNFVPSFFEGEEQDPYKRDYQQGQADFLESSIDSTINNSFQANNEVDTDTNFIPPPPDSVFTKPEKELNKYVEDELKEEPEPRYQRRYGSRPSRRKQQQMDPDLKAYRKAQEGDGTIYSANDNNQSRGKREAHTQNYREEAMQGSQRYNQQRTGSDHIASTQSRPPNPYQQERPGRGFQNSEHEQISGEMRSPQTPYTLMEGYLIPATLETGIDSDLPGDIRAFVTRDIYDSIQMKYLLIPKGTILVGSYDERVVLNQEKLLMSWERMIFPDGRSIRLPKLNSYDLQGKSGIAGKVDKHFWKIFGQSAFLSLIGAATNASMPQQGGFYQQRDAATMAGQQIAQEFNRVSNQVLRRNLNMAPTINIPGGTPFNIFLAGDISFQEPYEYTPPQE